MIAQKYLKKLAEICKKEFGAELPEAEVLKIATQLLAFYRAVYGTPDLDRIKEDKTDKFTK